MFCVYGVYRLLPTVRRTVSVNQRRHDTTVPQDITCRLNVNPVSEQGYREPVSTEVEMESGDAGFFPDLEDHVPEEARLMAVGDIKHIR